MEYGLNDAIETHLKLLNEQVRVTHRRVQDTLLDMREMDKLGIKYQEGRE